MSKKKRSKKPHRRMAKSIGSWQLSGWKNKHHNLAKSRFGTYAESNILIWDSNVHRAYHLIFNNMTLLEASDWLRHVDYQKKIGQEIDIVVTE